MNLMPPQTWSEQDHNEAQYLFTRYLLTSLQRNQYRYTKKEHEVQNHYIQLSVEEWEHHEPQDLTADPAQRTHTPDWASVMDTVADARLYRALNRLTPEETRLLYYRVVCELPPRDVELRMKDTFDSPAARYANILRKLRRWLS